MKVLLCLMATVAACNAGLLGGFGGNSVNQVQVQPQQLHHVQPVQQHIASAPQQQVQIIKIQNLGNGGGYSGGNGGGYSYGAAQSGGHGGGASHSQPQIIKVIHEQASQGGGYATQGYSNDHSQSYAPNHSSYQSSIESILPQILKIIYEDSGSSGGGSAYTNQLIDLYGSSGRAVITKGGNSADYLRSGHVVEKGHIEVVKVNRQNRGGSSGGSGGGIGSGIHSAIGGLFRGKW